jgi:hypothetical protein
MTRAVCQVAHKVSPSKSEWWDFGSSGLLAPHGRAAARLKTAIRFMPDAAARLAAQVDRGPRFQHDASAAMPALRTPPVGGHGRGIANGRIQTGALRHARRGRPPDGGLIPDAVASVALKVKQTLGFVKDTRTVLSTSRAHDVRSTLCFRHSRWGVWT